MHMSRGTFSDVEADAAIIHCKNPIFIPCDTKDVTYMGCTKENVSSGHLGTVKSQ